MRRLSERMTDPSPKVLPGDTLDPGIKLNIPSDLEALADEAEPAGSLDAPLEEEEALDLEEPDEADLEEIEVEEEEDLLEWSEELGDDPVRMYLKEISQVRLLDPDQEMWLATQMSAEVRLVTLRNKLVAQLRRQPKPDEIMVETYQNFLTAWDQVQKLCHKTRAKAPNLTALVREAHALRQGAPLEIESNLRSFLNNGRQDQEPVPSELLGALFETYVSLYLLPPEMLGWLADQLSPKRKTGGKALGKAGKALQAAARKLVSGNRKTPAPAALAKALPERKRITETLDQVPTQAASARQSLIRANLRLVVSVAKRYVGRASRSST